MTDPAAWGIEPGYHDVAGTWRPAHPDTVAAILDVMGAGGTAAPGGPGGPVGPGADPVWVVRHGQHVRVDGRWQLVREDGSESVVEGSADGLPLGYHRLRCEADGRDVSLIVTPHHCHLPPRLRTWGWAVQLPGFRSRGSWGIGDLADLRRLGEWSADHGAGMCLLNPLHASLPGLPQQASPYFASSRSFRNPIYLRVEEVPGATGLPGTAGAARAGNALNSGRTVDRDAVWELKAAVLEAAWGAFDGHHPDDAAFREFCARQGPALRSYGTFATLTEVHGRGWQRWPAGLRRPDSPEVDRFGAEHDDRVRFHMWLQWLVDRQLAAAGERIGLVQDLAIGADPAGADAWLWQDALALRVRVGAPPDEFNTAGQDWGFPPFDPWRLRAARFEPFISVVRSVLAHAAGLRVDHVAGLFRLFWIPPGAEPSRGAYVRYPWDEMLGIVALESVRAGAWVVGEDLGTVEPFVREELGRRHVLSTRLVWFEQEPPWHWPAPVFGAVTTHDLPTVAGLWSGADLREQRQLGLEPSVESLDGMRDRLRTWAGVKDGATVEDAVAATYRALGRSDSAVLVATLEDAAAVVERPNLPGTVDERPNWSLALPRPAEELMDAPLPAAIAAALRRS